MKSFKSKLVLALSISLLCGSLNLGAFASDKDYPIIYSVAPPVTELTVQHLPVQADE